MNVTFYRCEHCGNLVEMICDSGVPLVCCGQKMTQLKANTVDASKEKHIPVVQTEGNTLTVQVGSVDHPMIPEHFIQWVYIQTDRGGARKVLSPGEAPKVTFSLVDENLLAVYAYCNIHGLWMTTL